MNAHRFLILTAYVLTAVFAVIASKEYYTSDKRTNERPFLMGMRYGRAGDDDRPKSKVIVTPRNDKFFLPPRYGKRSNNPSQNYPFSPPLCGGTDDDLKCSYTGVSNIYRCIPSLGKDEEHPNAMLSTQI